jgi:acyl-CoA dehydrogenase
MDFSPTPLQQEVVAKAGAVAARFGDDYWYEIDKIERFPREFWDALAAESLLALPIAGEHGGAGLGILETVLAAEAVAARGCGMGGAIPFIVGPVFGGLIVERHGSAEQKQRFLPRLVEGGIWSGAFTEESSGANVTAIRTRAEPAGDGFLLHGEKKYIGVVEVADQMLVLARVAGFPRQRRTDGLSLFVVDLPAAGLTAERMEKMGTRYVDTNRVRLDGVRVEAIGLIGALGHGWDLMFDVLNAERLIVAAGAVGTGLLAIERAVAFANERRVWSEGEPIGSYQGLQFPLAKAKARLAAARLNVHQAAWLLDRGDPAAAIATTHARVNAIDAGLYAVDRGIQTLGSAGYLPETGLERLWRDLRVHRLAPLPDEMALAHIAQHDLGLPRSYGVDHGS